MRYLLIFLTILLIPIFSFTQNERKFIREGNKYYKKNNFNDAEVNYRKSLLNDSNYTIGKYNLANALYKEKNFDESSRILSELAEKQTDKTLKSKMYHNLGNSYLQKKEYEKSINSYIQALKNNPKDYDTKYNLSYAMQMLRKQQQQQQQDKNNDKKNNKKDEDKKNENKNQDNKQNQQNQDKKQQEQKQKQMKKEEAERMLEALKNDEKKTLDKVKKVKAVGAKISTDKDW